MELIKLKLRYPQSCQRCNKQLKKEWDVYYDKDTKAVYCLPCGELLLHEPVEAPDDIEIHAKLDNLLLQIMQYNTHIQVLHAEMKGINDKLSGIARIENKLNNDLPALMSVIKNIGKKTPSKPSVRSKKKTEEEETKK